MSAARGTACLMVAEAVFVLSGWAIHIGSKHILGIEYYGILGILLSLLTQYRVFLATGVNRAVSRYIAENPCRDRAIRHKSLRLQLILGLLVGAGVWVFAPTLAKIWNNPELTGYIRLTGCFLPVFGIYSVFRGTLNGFKLFEREALVSIIYSFFKVAFLFLLIWKFKVYGAVSGYLIAICVATVLAWSRCPSPGGKDDFPLGKIISFAIPVVSFSFLISLIQGIDLYFVRACAPNAGLNTGYYTCSQQFARIPYMFIYALGLTIFPNIAALSKNPDQAGRVVAKGLRWGILLVLPIACLISALAPELTGWVYGADTIPAGAPLRVLVFGQAILAILYLLSVILTASGKPWVACSLVGGTLVIDAALNYLLVPRFGIQGAAWATSISAFLGVVAASCAVKIRFHRLLNPRHVLNIVLAGEIIFLFGILTHPEGWLLPVAFVLLGLLGISIMVLLREIDRDDLRMLKSIFQRKSNLT